MSIFINLSFFNRHFKSFKYSKSCSTYYEVKEVYSFSISAVFKQTYPLTVFELLKNRIQPPRIPASHCRKEQLQARYIFWFNRRWCSLVFLLLEDIQMSENLLYHRLFVDEADDCRFRKKSRKPTVQHCSSLSDTICPAVFKTSSHTIQDSHLAGALRTD